MSSCCGHPHVALDRTKSSLKDAGIVVKSIIGTYKAEGTFGGIIFYKLANCQNGASKINIFIFLVDSRQMKAREIREVDFRRVDLHQFIFQVELEAQTVRPLNLATESL